MKQNLCCKLLNLHKYEVFKEEKLLDGKGNRIGIIIISRCSNCGKLKFDKVFTENSNGRY